MGCSGLAILPDCQYNKINDPLNYVLKPLESITDRSSDNNEGINTIFNRASDIMKLIEKQREKAIDKFDEAILRTGASVYNNPNITHCLRCLLFKMAYDLDGHIQSANIAYIEDPPYIVLIKDQLHTDTIEALDYLCSYIEDLSKAKLFTSQIDNTISELIYFLNENQFPDTSLIVENKKQIDLAVKVFPQLKLFISNAIKKYQYELYLLLIKNQTYAVRINFIGKEARKEKEKIKDIYQVAYTYKRIMKEYPLEYKDESMAFSIESGKMRYIDIINTKKKYKDKIYKQLMNKEKEV